MSRVSNFSTNATRRGGLSSSTRRVLDQVVTLAYRSTGADGACVHWRGRREWTCRAHAGNVPADGPAPLPASDVLLKATLRASQAIVSVDVARDWPDAFVANRAHPPEAWAGVVIGTSAHPRALLTVFARDGFREAPAEVRRGLDALAALATSSLDALPAATSITSTPAVSQRSQRPLAFVEWSLDGRIVDWSPAAERIFGYTADEARDMDGFQLVPEEARPHVQQVWSAQIQQEGGYFSTNPNRRKDGSLIVCEWYNTPLIDGDGDVVGVLSLAQDVTEREETAQRLQSSREFAEHLVVMMKEGVMVLDPEGVLLQVNDAFCEMTGFSREELVGVETPHPFWPPEHYQTMRDSFDRTLRGEFETVELPFVRRDGVRFSAVVSPAKLVNEAGDVVSYFATVKDVTDQKRAEAQLAHERELLQRIFDTIPVMIVVDDPATETVRVNRALEERIARGVATTPDADERLPLDVYDARVMRAFVHRLGGWSDLHIVTDDGTVVESSWLGMTLSDGTRLGLGIDVTDRKRRETELERARDAAEEMNRLKGAFLANMSHEIRTPLTSIMGFAEAIARNLEEAHDDDLSHHFAQLIQRGGRRLLDTLNSVLDLSRLEAGSIELEHGPLDLGAEIRDAVELLRPRADDRDLTLRVVKPATRVDAVLDASAFHSIVSNLLSNAIKFTPPGGIVFVRLQAEDDWIRIEVKDTGIGIDADFLPRLFEPFEQESTGPSRSYEGSGLGLAVARQFVELMGGTIHVNSVKGEGTHFIVDLPRQFGTEPQPRE